MIKIKRTRYQENWYRIARQLKMTTYWPNCKIFSKFWSIRSVESCISPEKWHSWNSSKRLLINKCVYRNKGQHNLLKHSAHAPFLNTQTPACSKCVLVTQEDWLLIGSGILATSVSLSPVGTRNPEVLSNTSVSGAQSPDQMFSCIFFLARRSISIQIFTRKKPLCSTFYGGTILCFVAIL